jgi:hypothetical protein
MWGSKINPWANTGTSARYRDNSNNVIAPAQNTIKPAWATWAPNNLPDKFVNRALPAHQPTAGVDVVAMVIRLSPKSI